MLNVDGWTDGRMNGRKLARLCLPAKAGATKSKFDFTANFLVTNRVVITRVDCNLRRANAQRAHDVKMTSYKC